MCARREGEARCGAVHGEVAQARMSTMLSQAEISAQSDAPTYPGAPLLPEVSSC